MAEHPIQGLMRTALESLKELVDVNTVIGDPVETQEGQVIIPVSRVSFGFAAGGTEFGGGAGKSGGRRGGYEEDGFGGDGQGGSFPFGGGSGAGCSVQPVGFLVVSKDSLRMLPVDGTRPMDKLIDVAPALLERLTAGRSLRAGDGNAGRMRLRRAGAGQSPGQEQRDQVDRLSRRMGREMAEGGHRERESRMNRS